MVGAPAWLLPARLERPSTSTTATDTPTSPSPSSTVTPWSSSSNHPRPQVGDPVGASRDRPSVPRRLRLRTRPTRISAQVLPTSSSPIHVRIRVRHALYTHGAPPSHHSCITLSIRPFHSQNPQTSPRHPCERPKRAHTCPSASAKGISSLFFLSLRPKSATPDSPATCNLHLPPGGEIRNPKSEIRNRIPCPPAPNPYNTA